jgi:enoyl-[acyl-carrier protein] reductase I
MVNLEGKVGLVVGIANSDSIAYGCAAAFRAAGAELAVTYLNAKAGDYVRPLAEELAATLVLPLNVQDDSEFAGVFEAIDECWGRLDFVLHSVAFCPREDLHGRVIDCSLQGFLTAMDVSCHSFIRLAQHAESRMRDGGCLLTVSFFGAQKVVPHYNIMGPVKSALESITRYMAAELGPQGIRVHALSPGPLRTRAASGIDHFDELLRDAAAAAPTHQLSTIEDVGHYATYLVSDVARNVTGSIHYIDGGYHIVG